MVRKVKRDGNRVSVTIVTEKGDETLRLTAPLWDEIGASEGDILDGGREDALRASSSLSETVTDAIRIVGDAPHSVSALILKLTRRGHPKDDARRAAAALVKSGVLDEADNARHVARSLFRRTKRGPARITAELLAKGYPSSLAREASDGISAEEYAEALRYHAGRLPEPKDEKSRAKTAAALSRLGFPAHEIKEILS